VVCALYLVTPDLDFSVVCIVGGGCMVSGGATACEGGAMMCVALATSWEPQEEDLMSIAGSFPSVRNQGLIDQ
jgi:hypothetical protein